MNPTVAPVALLLLLLGAIAASGGRRCRVASAVLAALLVAAVAGTQAGAWDTAVGDGTLGWLSIYIDNPQAGSLPASGWTHNEHAELTHVVLKELGVEDLFGLLPGATGAITVADLNSALYAPLVSAADGVGDDPGTLLEERRVPPPAHFAGLPDFSWAMHDWINKNTECPFPDEAPMTPPTLGPLEVDLCHAFGGWMGALNANHFGTQAKNMYERYHRIALGLAQRARGLREMLEGGALPHDQDAYREFVLEAEIEALAYEAIGQHFLEDRWATGHMWERWNASHYGADTPTFFESFVIAMAAGLMHGSEGITKLPDPMGSPVTSAGGTAADPVRWRIPGTEPRPGVGDYRLRDMHDGAFGMEYGLGDLPISVIEQRQQMIECAKAGWSEVIRAFGESSPGKLGAHEAVLLQGPFAKVLEDEDCWSPWVTNSAIAAGWLEHPSVLDVAKEARTFGQIATTTAVGELRQRLNPHLETTWRVISESAVRHPDSTHLARAGLGPFLGVAMGRSFPVPDYTEPVNLDSLPTSQPSGMDKHTLYGFFNRSHADWWCENFEDVIFDKRASALAIEQAACEYIANRVYKSTDPAYLGKRREQRLHSGEEVDPICRYYGVETAGVEENVPYHLHPGYVAFPYEESAYAYDSIGNWCRRVPVVDRATCPGDPEPPLDSDDWDVVGRVFANGGAVTLTGRNFGAEQGTVRAGSGPGVALSPTSWSDTQIELVLGPGELTAGDWFLEVCPAGDPGRCSVGRFILRVVPGGGGATSPLQSTFDSGTEGWTVIGAASFTAPGSDGNPGGYLRIDNDEGAALATLYGPASFTGDLSAFAGGTVFFDGNMLETGGADYESIGDYGWVMIDGFQGGGGFTDLLPGEQTGEGAGRPLKNTWTRFSAPLDAVTFNQPFNWNLILSNVFEFRLGVEALFGEEIQGIDNITLIPAAGDVCSAGP